MKFESKKRLELVLSKLKGFGNPKVRAEQYKTPPDIAALAIWHAYMKNNLKGRVSADLGCGSGILGIGSLLMGSKRVYFIDNDEEALKICENNLDWIKSEFSGIGEFKILNKDITLFHKKVDIIFQNPPFGTKVKHADRDFLVKAFEISHVVYSFHKSETSRFVEAISKDNGMKIEERISLKMPLQAQFQFHRRKIYRINVDLYRIVRTDR